MKPELSEKSHLIRSGTGRQRILFNTNIVLLIALIIIIFVIPAAANIHTQEYYLTRGLLSVIVVSGLFAAEFTRTAFRVLATIGTMVILVTLVDMLFPQSQHLSTISFLLNTLFFIIVTIALVAHVAVARLVDSSTLLCAINSYLLIGLTLSLLFLILDILIPESFTQANATEGGLSAFIYYGFVTLTTLGYGDITPANPVARSLASFTALFGQLYLVIIMALIIGKYLSGKKDKN
jgi:hypothetical protein